MFNSVKLKAGLDIFYQSPTNIKFISNWEKRFIVRLKEKLCMGQDWESDDCGYTWFLKHLKPGELLLQAVVLTQLPI